MRERALGRPPHAAAQTSRAMRWALFIAVAAHLAVIFGLREAMRTPSPAVEERSVRVELIELNPPEPPLPQPAPLPPRAIVAHAAQKVAPARETPPPVAAEHSVDDTPSVHLYNADGTLDIPKDLVQQIDNAAAAQTFKSPSIAMAPFMKHARPLKVRPNHFAPYWAASDGLLGSVFDKLTAEKGFTLPWGTRVECKTIAFLVGGCGWYTPYPYYIPTERWKPATELDER
ncbi:MAG TPA: hypothetical protein VF132_08420 [Rudaea sp.]